MIRKPNASGVGIDGSDFTIPTPPRKQAGVVIYGQEKTGKTTFATMYCPEPVCLISFDGRSRLAAHKAIEQGRQVNFLELSMPHDLNAMTDEQAVNAITPLLNRANKNIQWAFNQAKSGNVKTLCLDTATEFTLMMSIFESGKASGKKWGDKGSTKDKVNQQWLSIFSGARLHELNLVVLSRAKEIWVNDKSTGLFAPRPPEVICEAADWVGQLKVETQLVKKQPPKLKLEMFRTGGDWSEMGKVYTEADWDLYGGPFAYACIKQFPNTSPEDWQ